MNLHKPRSTEWERVTAGLGKTTLADMVVPATASNETLLLKPFLDALPPGLAHKSVVNCCFSEALQRREPGDGLCEVPG